MASNGCKEAQQMLDRHNSNPNSDEDFYEQYYGARHSPHLVEAVEALGYKSWYDEAQLTVMVVEGDRYLISEYDGFEEVKEPKDIDWTFVYRT